MRSMSEAMPPWTETEAWLVGYIADLKQTPHRYAAEISGLEIVLKRLRAALTSPPKAGAGEPVTWRVKDFADGWIYHTDEARARRLAEHMSGALVEPLYATPEPRRDGVMVTDEMVEAACVGYWPAHWQQGHIHTDDKSSIRRHMRAALEAALNPEQGETP